VGSIPVLCWLPKARAEMCSFDIRTYGSQCKIDPYAQYHTAKCGNCIVYDPGWRFFEDRRSRSQECDLGQERSHGRVRADR
jgi:hypothetical protein